MAKQHKAAPKDEPVKTPAADESHAHVEPSQETTNEPQVVDVPEETPEVAEQPEVIADTHESTPTPTAGAKSDKKKFDFKAFIKTTKGKVVVGLAVLVVVVGLVFAIPTSRYAVAGLVIKKDVRVAVVDSISGKPVSGVDIAVAGQTGKTDPNGKVTLRNVPVGSYQVAATKKYFEDTKASTLVPILSNQTELQLSMAATGRQVPVKTTNKITGEVLGGVEVTAGEAVATTAEDGLATLVLPADQTAVDATLKKDGFNTATAAITVTEQPDDKNTFALTPSGKVYFLSKRTGKINVMKSDLDGANPSVVVAATGQEQESQTVLLASRDWEYLALQARRDSIQPKLYLVKTATDALTVIDEGADVTFTPIGWSNESFIYKVSRDTVQAWQPKQASLKSFNAKTGQITTLEDTDAVGSGSNSWATESISNAYIMNDVLVYAKYWNNSYGGAGLLAGKKDVIYQVKPSGQDKKAVKDFDATVVSYIQAQLYRPDEVYFRASSTPVKYYEYHDGTVSETSEVNDANFYGQSYNTYLVSPSGKSTFWSEQRDGKNVSLVGDAKGANGKEVLTSTSFKPYGWFTDDYLLLSKDNSELFIMARGTQGGDPIKITDYHRPSVTFPGYGYGYGGN